MDMIIGIFQSLGVDQTIFIQFGVILVFYVVISQILFKKLLTVLQERENKTVGLVEAAALQSQAADELASKYQDEVAQAYRQSQTRIESVRSKIKNENLEIVQKEEHSLQVRYQKAKEHSISEVEVVRGNLMKSSDELTQSLVEKIIN
ncbi:MAG: hypothetical protein HN353_02290 [Bdellovibrionales bacterium]|jgi:F0F1-type ATP synthase membrane subunit b/b'|nr:hypothetical protein [Bdellovibrionales bacterium]MBT3525515.1 hypothetical protein [Bdellovibrionales bacterium]MBT7667952.1 hypothetical protein [Bdellovibrionales bacterium]MBT7765597.1 hypothetical protein [Bdellovibrionales bacterium]